MKRIGSGQLMVTEDDKVVMPNLIGASRMAQPSQGPHQHLLLHSIQEDGSSQVSYLYKVCALVYGLCNYLDDSGRTLLLQPSPRLGCLMSALSVTDHNRV